MTSSSQRREDIRIVVENSQIKAGRDSSIIGKQQDTLIESMDASAVVTVVDDNVLSPADDDSIALVTVLAEWQASMDSRIEALTGLLTEDKEDLKEIVAKVRIEVEKAEKASPGRLACLLNSLAVMGPDILEVVIATLASPLHDIGLVLRKIGDKARVERQTQEE